jgi:GNAT superfamily N-acetyltransferase
VATLVRRATLADAEALLRLNDQFNGPGTPLAHIQDHLAQRAAFETPFVAEVEGYVAGMACLRLLPCAFDHTPYAELTELYVEEAYRRRGLARALFAHIEAVAREAGASQLALITAWRNTEAHAFYHAIGYRLWCISMERSLGDRNES